MTGFIMSAVILLIQYSSIKWLYQYMPESVIILAGMTVFCFVLFWMVIKYDRFLEINDVYRKTISIHDFNLNSAGLPKLFIKYVRPINPYIGIAGTIMVVVFVLCAVPAVILYWVVNSELMETWLKILVVLMSFVMSALYLVNNRDSFSPAWEKIVFGLGILCGTLGPVYIIL